MCESRCKLTCICRATCSHLSLTGNACGNGRAELTHPSGTDVPSTMEPHDLIAVGPHTTCIAPFSGVRLPVTMGLSNDAHGSPAARRIYLQKDHFPRQTTDVCYHASYNRRRLANKLR
jgi:hypothetical protein